MKNWVELLSALLTPTIAILGAVFAYLQWNTAEKSRQNELFDRRHAFYLRLKNIYLSQHGEEVPPLGTEDWAPLAEEAGFLFGADIQAHVLSLDERPVTGSPFFPDDWFVQPFNKYLHL